MVHLLFITAEDVQCALVLFLAEIKLELLVTDCLVCLCIFAAPHVVKFRRICCKYVIHSAVVHSILQQCRPLPGLLCILMAS
jgi:hypothetical protein